MKYYLLSNNSDNILIRLKTDGRLFCSMQRESIMMVITPNRIRFNYFLINDKYKKMHFDQTYFYRFPLVITIERILIPLAREWYKVISE